MRICSLCQKELIAAEADRVSGLDICSPCRISEPTDSLMARGIRVEWDVRFGWFHAGLGLPGADPDFHLSCVPEMLHHKVIKWVQHEVQVGDPAFDKQIYVRTSDPGRAAQVLANEGVQSCLLTFLTEVRTNDIKGNHVTLKGPTLTLSSRRLTAPSQEQILELKVETAVLAILLSVT